MITKQAPARALLAADMLDECLHSIGQDYLAAIVLNAERGAAMRARHDAYVTALAETLAETVEASVGRMRGARSEGQS